MYVLGGGQTLFNNGFTLIELLAVIVVLAIIALIAIPQILNLINDSKMKSAEISVQNYLRALDIAIKNKEVMGEKILDGVYNITEEGTLLDYPDNIQEKDIKVEFEGKGLTEGKVVLDNGKITEVKKGKIDNWSIDWKQGETIVLKEYKEDIKVTLVTGQEFNSKIKTLANEVNKAYNSADTIVTSIEFYSNEELPTDQEIVQKIKQLKENQQHVDMSFNKDESILAYCIEGKVYIISDNLISFNSQSNNMFYNFQSVTNINFSEIDTSSVTTMNQMFLSCYKLSQLDVSKFNTSKVTDMTSLFSGCKVLTNLDVSEFDTINVENMSEMFKDCNKLISLDVSKFDTSNVTNMDSMFRGCSSLTQLNVTNFKTDNVTDMGLMFYNCKLLTSLDVSNFNTSKVNDMSMMFCICSGLKTLDVSNFNTSEVTNMNGMFYGCSGLTGLDVSKFNTSNVTNMMEMFRGCNNLINLDLSKFNTSGVTTMKGMFYACRNLTTLDVSNFDTNKVTDMVNMFISCANLTTIEIGCGWKTSTNNESMFSGSSYSLEQLNYLVEKTQVTCPTS